MCLPYASFGRLGRLLTDAYQNTYCLEFVTKKTWEKFNSTLKSIVFSVNWAETRLS